jgi:hypothetical protein
MIKSLGPGLDTTDFIRIALGSQHTFIVVQNSNLSKPLVISWPQLLQQIQNQITVQSSGTIEVQDEGAIIDATAQFLNFVGAGVTVTQNGNGVDITIPGGGGTTPSLQQVVNVGNGISNFGGIGNASIQSTNFTSNRTLYLNNNSNPTIKIEDNANSSHYIIIDIDTLNLNGTSYNWSSIVNPPGGVLVALPFTTDHLAITNNPYLIGDVVYYLGDVYRCIANNDSILPTNALYWTNLGAGFPLVQQPADWNSTSGNNQILNKPTIGDSLSPFLLMGG